MGKKNCELSSDIRKEIIRIFMEMEESDVSRVFDNDEFGFWSVTVERSLKLRIYPDRKIPSSVFKKAEEAELVRRTLETMPDNVPLDDWSAFAKATKLKSAILKKFVPILQKNPLMQRLFPEKVMQI